jgi:hypothetical protein
MPFLLPALSSLVADILIIYLVYDNDNGNGNGNGSSAQTAAPSSNEPQGKKIDAKKYCVTALLYI